jgi:hypothetical protein
LNHSPGSRASTAPGSQKAASYGGKANKSEGVFPGPSRKKHTILGQIQGISNCLLLVTIRGRCNQTVIPCLGYSAFGQHQLVEVEEFTQKGVVGASEFIHCAEEVGFGLMQKKDMVS